VFEAFVSGNSLFSFRSVAGGGRYDDLMRAVGSAEDVPAVGAAIHTEHLLAAISGGAT
jgi:ATP phosphoribosyltransferase regulatory subunit